MLPYLPQPQCASRARHRILRVPLPQWIDGYRPALPNDRKHAGQDLLRHMLAKQLVLPDLVLRQLPCGLDKHGLYLRAVRHPASILMHIHTHIHPAQHAQHPAQYAHACHVHVHVHAPWHVHAPHDMHMHMCMHMCMCMHHMHMSRYCSHPSVPVLAQELDNSAARLLSWRQQIQ